MTIFFWIIFGVIAGMAASMQTGKKQLIFDIIFGSAGAALGVFLMYLVDIANADFSFFNLLAAFFSAALLIWSTRKVHL